MARAIVYGGIVVGTLDLLDALIFFGLRGVAPMRICQSIAAGVLGRASYQGGLRSAALGLALHYVIAFLIVTVFYLTSRLWPVLVEHAVVSGILYGIAAYFVMNDLVIPLSATARGPFVLPMFINGILIHAFGVGLPSALFARLYR
jgi:predicted anti-sigma-YlaC factor YlaD